MLAHKQRRVGNQATTAQQILLPSDHCCGPTANDDEDDVPRFAPKMDDERIDDYDSDGIMMQESPSFSSPSSLSSPSSFGSSHRPYSDTPEYENENRNGNIVNNHENGSNSHHRLGRAFFDVEPNNQIMDHDQNDYDDDGLEAELEDVEGFRDDPTTGGTKCDTVHDQLPTFDEIHNSVRLNAAAVLKRQPGQGRRPRRGRGIYTGSGNTGGDDHYFNWRKSRRLRCWMVVGVAFLVAVGAVSIWAGQRRLHQQHAVDAVTTDSAGVRISHPDAFQDNQSPQSKALQWMLQDDSLALPLPQDRTDPFVQRYILAVVVFAVAGDEARERFHLLNPTGDPNRSHECSWNGHFRRADEDHAMGSVELGILCDNDNFVTGIIMPSAGLAGELPLELESLLHLERLVLDNNQIRFSSNNGGDSLGGNSYGLPVMPYLTYLSLAHNALTGALPDDSYFSEMSRLTTLSFSENALQGSLPPAMAALTDLRLLALDGNELTGGLSTSVYRNAMTNLQELYLAYNSFEDRLSNDSFQQLTDLKVLDLKSNKLSGPLPDALWALTNLEVLDVHHNAFDGHINDVVAPGHAMQFLDLSENLLDKGLPPSMRHLTQLTHLDLSYNRFDQLLPGVSESGDTSFILATMTKMQTLLLTENDAFGPQGIPHWIRGMNDLKRLSFRLTSRIGPIPTWLGELTKLELLDLDWNRLSGQVPTELGQLTRLKYLLLNRNLLTGEIPLEITGGLPRLKTFMVDNNDFHGTVDTCLEGMVHMVADCGNPDQGCPDCDSNTQKISCPCCTDCCYEDAMRCNMDDWATVQAEHEYRGDYHRYSYTFDKVEYIQHEGG